MRIAFEAMQFAREVHKDQRRINLRTIDRRILNALVSLYEAGLQVSWIAREIGVSKVAIRNYVANHAIARKPEKFEDGVACLSANGEEFRRLHWATNYFTSNHGRVIGVTIDRPGTVLKPSVLPSGYHTVKLVENDGIARHNYVHRAVLRAFCGDPDDGMEGAHGDGNPANNCLLNLRWDTHSGNDKDKDAHGTRPVGSRHANAKINESMAMEIKARLAYGESQPTIVRSMKVSTACVANIAKGKTWKNLAQEFV